MINTKFTNDLLTKQIQKLEDEALKPMSILEIKEKFNLNFPFKVKRVKLGYDKKTNIVGLPFEFTTITEIKKHLELGFITNNKIESNVQLWVQCAEVQDYILYEEN